MTLTKYELNEIQETMRFRIMINPINRMRLSQEAYLVENEEYEDGHGLPFQLNKRFTTLCMDLIEKIDGDVWSNERTLNLFERFQIMYNLFIELYEEAE